MAVDAVVFSLFYSYATFHYLNKTYIQNFYQYYFWFKPTQISNLHIVNSCLTFANCESGH